MNAEEFHKLTDEDKVLKILNDERYAICVKKTWHIFISRAEAISLCGRDSSYITYYDNGEWTMPADLMKYFGVSPK